MGSARFKAVVRVVWGGLVMKLRGYGLAGAAQGNERDVRGRGWAAAAGRVGTPKGLGFT